MDGWMDGWIDGSMDGWMDVWMDACMYACIYFFSILNIYNVIPYFIPITPKQFHISPVHPHIPSISPVYSYFMLNDSMTVVYALLNVARWHHSASSPPEPPNAHHSFPVIAQMPMDLHRAPRAARAPRWSISRDFSSRIW